MPSLKYFYYRKISSVKFLKIIFFSFSLFLFLKLGWPQLELEIILPSECQDYNVPPHWPLIFFCFPFLFSHFLKHKSLRACGVAQVVSPPA
jgi:hypothetical protein